MVAPKMRSKAATRRRYSVPPLCMPKTSSISPALRNRMTGLFCCTASVAKENRHNTILPEWHSELCMPGDLRHELAIALFIHQLTSGQSSHGQAAQDKRPGSKAELLGPLLPVHLENMNS